MPRVGPGESVGQISSVLEAKAPAGDTEMVHLKNRTLAVMLQRGRNVPELLMNPAPAATAHIPSPLITQGNASLKSSVPLTGTATPATANTTAMKPLKIPPENLQDFI